MHRSRKYTNCLSSLWVAINRAVIARNALTLPHPRYCVLHKKIKIHLAVQRQQLWGSTLQSRRPLQRKDFPDHGQFIFWTVPRCFLSGVVMNRLKGNTSERGNRRKEGNSARTLKSLIWISKTMNWNSNKLNGHKTQVPELNWVDSPLSAYCIVRQPPEHLEM